MKKIIIIISAIILVIMLFFGIKVLLDFNSEDEIQNITEDSGMEWEIEAEYRDDGNEVE